MEKRLQLILFLALLLVVVSLITAITASTRETVTSVYTASLIDQKDPVSLTLLMKLSEHSGVSVSRMIIKNTGSRPAILSVSCNNTMQTVEVRTGESSVLENLQLPCWVIPESPVNVTITVEIIREVTPYAWMSLISLLSLLLSLGLFMLFTYMILLKKMEKASSARK